MAVFRPVGREFRHGRIGASTQVQACSNPPLGGIRYAEAFFRTYVGSTWPGAELSSQVLGRKGGRHLGGERGYAEYGMESSNLPLAL